MQEPIGVNHFRQKKNHSMRKHQRERREGKKNEQRKFEEFDLEGRRSIGDIERQKKKGGTGKTKDRGVKPGKYGGSEKATKQPVFVGKKKKAAGGQAA